MKKQIKILWILGPKEYLNSGIGKYSKLFINYLKDSSFAIKEKIIPFQAKSISRYIYQFLFLPLYLFIISKKYDKVIIYEESLSWLVLFIRTYKIIIVHDARFFSKEKPNSLREKIKSFLLKSASFFINKYDLIIAPSNFTKNELIKSNINANIEVIYNPIEFKETNIAYDIFKKYNINNVKDRIILLFVGSEESRKNFITLLRLIQKYKNKYILIKIGKPIINKNRQFHLKYIEDNNIKNNIYIIDEVSESELSSFYRKADIFVNPSLFEGFGRTPIEAQYHMLPVVSTKKGALKEVLNDSCLYVSDPYSIEEYNEKISSLVSNNILREEMIKRGLENVKRFSIDSLGKKISLLLEIV